MHALTIEKGRPQGNAALIPISPTARPGNGSYAAREPNHFAVVIVDSEGQELRGWDFQTFKDAKTFADKLWRKELLVEVLARNEFGERLARFIPGPAPQGHGPPHPSSPSRPCLLMSR
jgi:hypothetical protein